MMAQSKIPLAQQREDLRAKLQAQREVIALKLAIKEAEEESYPRSMVMRFLTKQPVATIAAEAATLFLGAKLIKSINSLRTVLQMVKSFRRGSMAA